MKIIVCIKQVPDTETKIKILPDKAGIDTNGIKWVMNPYDEFAVEEGVKIRDANPGSQLYVLTAGPKSRCQEVLRTALAMGADEGVLVNAPEGLDSFASAKLASAAILAEGAFDLILTGKLAIDANHSGFSQALAEFLSIPHATVLSKIQIKGNVAEVSRDIEGGSKENLQVNLPAVLAANKGLNLPRYASLPGIMKAKKKVLKELEAESLVPGLKSRIRLFDFNLPPEKPPVQLIEGDVKKQVADLVTRLRDEAKVL